MDASSMDMEETSMTVENGTANSTTQPIIQVDKMMTMKKKSGLSKPQHIISQEEEQLNPQLNQLMKKQQKAQQKKARRQAEAGGQHASNDLIEEDDDMMHEESAVPTAATFTFNTGLMSAPIPDEDEEL